MASEGLLTGSSLRAFAFCGKPVQGRISTGVLDGGMWWRCCCDWVMELCFPGGAFSFLVLADRFREVLSLLRDAVRVDVQWLVGDETTLARCLLSAWM